MGAPVGVGVIGAGNISDTYLEHLTSFPDVTVHVVGDLDVDRARAQADAYGVRAAGDGDAVLAHPDVELVVNLTVPAVHAEISTAAVEAGKHVWSEKPIGVDRAGAAALLERAAARGVRVGVAPDTVLGPGVQSARRAIARGDIGRPLFAQTTFQWQGPELFHPNPGFLYARGAGPLLDMGPYYVSTLVHVFGPVASVVAVGQRAFDTRTVRVGPFAGQEFPVEITSTVHVLTEFEQGGQAQSLYSTDSALRRQGVVEITGTEGTIVIPDPNGFSGRIALVRPLSSDDEEQVWVDVEQEGVVVGRGLGALDLARAVREDRPHLATGELGYHVLDTLLSIEESVERGGFVEVASTVGVVGAMPADFDPYARTV
ncbi:Gfo/Idh/MocA family oxidoreductase [Agromyces intestinalis]|uniref:Gfo/Idh/MocA family oxidoreductase n=1 Tax=Agromyces intestinalis TaxID=2592652 RepID=A0A5C1YH45_9MICO|nr:Gfo/Idh/MocA family oxidoreductase [Agromyces intestinalis]QEO14419.1 Gfo/Idh/MocA family oxidoreductase [Agromyces intestinalis]